MFEDSANNDASYKKKKAIFYAGIVTFLIAVLYIYLIRHNLYRFGGVKKDVAPLSSFLQEVKQSLSKDIKSGNQVIVDNKK